MLADSSRIPFNSSIEADVCIVGAGPAGIAIGREFDGHAATVVLLESGDIERDAAIQSLADGDGEPVGDIAYPGAGWSRTLAFGGTTDQWCVDVGGGKLGARYTPLDPIDFEQRGWVPHSGWPITRRDLDPYLARAQAACGSGPFDYEPDRWEGPGSLRLRFPQALATTKMFQFGPSSTFTEVHREQLRRSTNVTVMLKATALDLDVGADGVTVSRVRIGSLSGNRFDVRAKIVILAVGGHEAPRLLLLSNRVHRDGLGNRHGNVGRYLMDHQAVSSGCLNPPDPSIIATLGLYDTRIVDGSRVTAKVVLTEETMRREHLLNICAALYPRTHCRKSLLRSVFPAGPQFRSPAIEAAAAIKRAFAQGGFPDRPLSRLAQIATGLDDLLYFQDRRRYARRAHRTFHFDRGGWSSMPSPGSTFSRLEVVHMTEQAPDPTNRIVLGEARDPFGRRRLAIHWRLNDIDIESIRRAQSIFADAFSSVGLGPLELVLDRGAPKFFKLSLHHPMGTTRMHADPRHGVVDADCRVHGLPNLYIASSAVFTTGGFANPTLTIVALAIRVADTAKQRLAERNIAVAS